jgi:hypothetical protein
MDKILGCSVVKNDCLFEEHVYFVALKTGVREEFFRIF